MKKSKRQITYAQAINEALHQAMERDPTIFVYGIGVPDHKRVFGTTEGLVEQFGPQRCFDTPLSEAAMTGFGIGAALNGLRPVHIHLRVDFMLLALSQLVNMASTYAYITNGRGSVPLVIRAIIGRGWGQGCHHSKSLHSYFTHIPGIKVVAPSRPEDVKGLLIAALRGNDPTIVLEHRWLYWGKGIVPEVPYQIPIGLGNCVRFGSDVTIVATSWQVVEALKAAELLARRGVEVEVIDPRTLVPLDDQLIVKSVNQTGCCIVVDNDWVDSGFGAEVAARVSEQCFGQLRYPVTRLGWAHTPCPTARHLENEFYPNAVDIIRAVEQKLGLGTMDLSDEDFYSHERKFRGPF